MRVVILPRSYKMISSSSFSVNDEVSIIRCAYVIFATLQTPQEVTKYNFKGL